MLYSESLPCSVSKTFFRFFGQPPNHNKIQWQTGSNGQKQGLITQQELKDLVGQGIITPETPLETDGGHKGKAGQVKGLFLEPAVNPFASSPPQQPYPQSVPVQQPMLYCSACGNQVLASAFVCPRCGTKVAKPGGGGGGIHEAIGETFGLKTDSPQKSRTVYVLLTIFLFGGIGLHNFYAGRTKQAIIQLVIGLIGFLLIIPLLVTCVWAIYDAITVKEDGLGRPFV